MPKKPTPKSHRHFVAAPLALLIISISVMDGVLPAASQSPELSASVMQLSEGEVLSFQGGVQAILYSGEGFNESDGLIFEGGSSLVSSDGIVNLSVAGADISAVNGAFYLSYHEGDVTIAAITSPVVVRDGARLMIIPAGMQWRTGSDVLPLLQAGYPLWLQARQVKALPNRFLTRQLQNLSFLPEVDVLPEARVSEPLPLWTKLPTLKVGASRKTAELEWRKEVLGTFRGLVEAGEEDAAYAFLLDDQYEEILNSEDAYDMLARLLSRTSETSVRSLLLTQLIQDEDYWLVSSLHPDLREETWSLFSEHQNPEAHTLRLLLLPKSNITQNAVPSSVMQRWVYELSKLAEGENAAPLVHVVLEQSLSLVSMFEEQGYPERSRILASALLTLVENAQVALPEELASGISELETLGRVSIEIVEPIEVAEEEPVDIVDVEQEEVAEEPSYSPDVVEKRSYVVLRDIGALFTVETAIDAVAPNTAHVQSVIFPTQRGDQKVDLHFNVAKGEVNQIVIGSKEYPYALSVEAFRDWIRK